MVKQLSEEYKSLLRDKISCLKFQFRNYQIQLNLLFSWLILFTITLITIIITFLVSNKENLFFAALGILFVSILYFKITYGLLVRDIIIFRRIARKKNKEIMKNYAIILGTEELK